MKKVVLTCQNVRNDDVLALGKLRAFNERIDYV